MRIVFSVIGLLLVVFVVMQLTKTQLRALAPSAAPKAVAGQGTAVDGAPAVAPQAVPRQVADDVRRAVDAGLSARASDAER